MRAKDMSHKDIAEKLVTFTNKPLGKALVQVQHENLRDEEGIARWRAYWKSVIKTIA
jgi:hypothetical protein